MADFELFVSICDVASGYPLWEPKWSFSVHIDARDANRSHLRVRMCYTFCSIRRNGQGPAQDGYRTDKGLCRS